MKTRKQLLGIAAITIGFFVGCSKKAEEQPQNNPAPPATTTKAEVSKATELSVSDQVDENETISLAPPISEQLTLKEINRRIQTEELSPTNTYYEFPKDAPVGVNEGKEKPLSSLKGLAHFARPTSPPYSRNLYDEIKALDMSASGELTFLLQRGPREGCSAAQINKASGEIGWRFEIPTPKSLTRTGPPSTPVVHTFSEPKTTAVAVNSRGDSGGWESWVIAVNAETGKEIWTKKLPTSEGSANPATFDFVESKYVFVPDDVSIRAIDVSKGEQIWSTKVESHGSARDELKGPIDGCVYMYQQTGPAIYSLNVTDGTMKSVITLPQGWTPVGLSSGGQSDRGSDRPGFEWFGLKLAPGSSLLVVDAPRTDVQCFSLPNGNLLWKRSHREIATSIMDDDLRGSFDSFMADERPVAYTVKNGNVLVSHAFYEAVISAKSGETISCLKRTREEAD